MDVPSSIITSESSKTQKATCCQIWVMWNVQSGQIHRMSKLYNICKSLEEESVIGMKSGI